mmetsp:Transcript_33811/g.54794  ORF Transcript_33811/g.54794 Transcript_33811/m.54794 type:complete len:1076 (+) Transcript_33811:213-3440(+)
MKTISSQSSAGSRVGQKSRQMMDVDPSEDKTRVEDFLSCIPKDLLAGAAYRCKANARALLYFETHLRNKKPEKTMHFRPYEFGGDEVSFLQRVYSGLNDPDGMSGITSLRKTMTSPDSFADTIFNLENAGDWTEALTCYEQALQRPDLKPQGLDVHGGVLRCMRNLGTLQMMLTHVDGMLATHPEEGKPLTTYAVQAAWRLGNWDLLTKYLQISPETPDSQFEVALSRILLAFKNRDDSDFREQLSFARDSLLPQLSAAGMESYQRAYPFIVRLHMLNELEDAFAECILRDAGRGRMDGLKHWEARLKLVEPSLTTMEPILSTRRIAYNILDLTPQVAQCWQQLARTSRVAGHVQTALNAVRHASACNAPTAHIEMAKLEWNQGNTHRAVLRLERRLKEHADHSQGNRMEAAVHAKTLLLKINWVQQMGQQDSESVIKDYKSVISLQPNWEKGYMYLGRYLDVLVEAQQDPSRPRSVILEATERGESTRRLFPLVVYNYGQSLVHGCTHLYQSLPRLLTLWLDYGASVPDSSPPSRPSAPQSNQRTKAGSLPSSSGGQALPAAWIRQVNEQIAKFGSEIPLYCWYTALPQMISRIMHKNVDVFNILRTIISRVVCAYPQQALWMLIPICKSANHERRQRAEEIRNTALAMNRDANFKTVVTKSQELITNLISLSTAQVPSKAKVVLLQDTFKPLARLLPVPIMVPVQRALTVALPADGKSDTNHVAFPSTMTTIFEIRNEIEIMASLQKPRKIVIRGADGMDYPFLAKQENRSDMRKDSRMIEFNTLLNRLFVKNPDTRPRKLQIRTYAVIPLCEECGFIEWINNLCGLRPSLNAMYKNHGVDAMNTARIKELWDSRERTTVQTYRDVILPMYPPLLHKWFLSRFPEPTAWFQARLNYTRSVAVWSMVGHVVGLGDRHGENILLDSTNGECIHVDLSCLFDKGQELATPEVVPFRLTPNMIDCFGLAGVEGTYRRNCEITMKLLRDQRETLMNVLDTFIHDPLVDWKTPNSASKGGESEADVSRRIFKRIQGRLTGIIGQDNLQLSVQGHVHQLIAQATSAENLGRMYIWWMPWY